MNDRISRLTALASVLLFTIIGLRSTLLAEDWPKYRHDNTNTGKSGETTLLDQTNIKLKWKFNTGTTISASPAVATISGRSLVFVGSWNGMFYALDAVSGQEVWTFHVDAVGPCTSTSCRIGSSAAVDSGMVYFGAENAFVYGLNASNGALIWKRQVGDPNNGYEVWSSPAVYQGVLYVGAASHGDDPCVIGKVFALNSSTGSQVWVFQTIDESPSSCSTGQCVGAGVWASPAIDTANGILYVGTGNPGSTCVPPTPNATRYPDSIVSLTLATGHLVSYFQAIANDKSDLDFGSSPIYYFTSCASTCNPGYTYYWISEANKNGKLYSCKTDASGVLSSCAGELLDPSGVVASPALKTTVSISPHQVQQDVLTPTESGNLYDTIVTSLPLPTPYLVASPTTQSILSAPAIEDTYYERGTDGVIIFGANNGVLYDYKYVCCGGKATLLFSFATGGAIDSGPAISNSRIYFGSNDGNVYCLSVNGQ